MCFGLCDIGSAVKILGNASMFSAGEWARIACKIVVGWGIYEGF